jgi:hypothetical protein
LRSSSRTTSVTSSAALSVSRFFKNRLFGFASLTGPVLTGTQNYARDILLSTEQTPRLTRGNDTPEEPGMDQLDHRADIRRCAFRTILEAPGRTRTTVGFDRPAEDYSGRADWQRGADSITGRYSTRTRYSTRRRDSGEVAKQDHRQQNLGFTGPRCSRPRGRRGSLLARHPGHEREHQGGQRYADRAVHGLAGVRTIIGNAGNFPILRDQADNQFVYNLSWLLGQNHSFKAGTDVRRVQLDDFADNSSRGTWTFDRVCGGVTYPTAYDAFLDGCIASYVKGYGPFFLENRLNEANFYAEDSWRVDPSLTVNLGLRYEYVSAPKEKEDRIDYGIGADTNNYAPRLSAAWTLPAATGWLRWLSGEATGDAAVRGGFGIAHGRVFQSVFSQTGASLRTNPPNALSRTYTTLPGLLNVSDPSLGFVFVPGPQTTRHSITIASPDWRCRRRGSGA